MEQAWLSFDVDSEDADSEYDLITDFINSVLEDTVSINSSSSTSVTPHGDGPSDDSALSSLQDSVGLDEEVVTSSSNSWSSGLDDVD